MIIVDAREITWTVVFVWSDKGGGIECGSGKGAGGAGK